MKHKVQSAAAMVDRLPPRGAFAAVAHSEVLDRCALDTPRACVRGTTLSRISSVLLLSKTKVDLAPSLVMALKSWSLMELGLPG